MAVWPVVCIVVCVPSLSASTDLQTLYIIDEAIINALAVHSVAYYSINDAVNVDFPK